MLNQIQGHHRVLCTINEKPADQLRARVMWRWPGKTPLLGRNLARTPILESQKTTGKVPNNLCLPRNQTCSTLTFLARYIFQTVRVGNKQFLFSPPENRLFSVSFHKRARLNISFSVAAAAVDVFWIAIRGFHSRINKLGRRFVNRYNGRGSTRLQIPLVLNTNKNN